jgi:hypothetical protein
MVGFSGPCIIDGSEDNNKTSFCPAGSMIRRRCISESWDLLKTDITPKSSPLHRRVPTDIR